MAFEDYFAPLDDKKKKTSTSGGSSTSNKYFTIGNATQQKPAETTPVVTPEKAGMDLFTPGSAGNKFKVTTTDDSVQKALDSLSTIKMYDKNETLSMPTGKEKLPLIDRIKRLFGKEEKSSVANTIKTQDKALQDQVKSGTLQTPTFENLRAIDRSTKFIGKNTAKDFAEGLIGDASVKDIPFAGGVASAGELADILNTGNKLKSGKDVSPDQAKRFYDFYLTEQAKSNKRESSRAYRTAEGIKQSLSFGIELLATSALTASTGGAAAPTVGAVLAEQGTLKGVKKIVGEMVTDKVAREIFSKELKKYGIEFVKKSAITVGTQELVHAPAGTIERILDTPSFSNQNGSVSVQFVNDGQNIKNAVVNSFTNVLSDTASEYSGSLLHFLPNAAKNIVIKSGIMKSFLKTNDKIVPEAVTSVIEKMGWNGFVEEILEERVSDVMKGAFEKAGIGDQEFKLPTKDQLIDETLSILLTGGIYKAGAKAYNYYATKKAEETLPEEDKKKIDDFKAIINNQNDAQTADELKKQLISIGVSEEIANEMSQNDISSLGEDEFQSILDELLPEQQQELEDTTQYLQKEGQADETMFRKKEEDTVESIKQAKQDGKTFDEWVKNQKQAEYSPLTIQQVERSIKSLNESGIPVKSGDDILTLYHGTNAKGVKGITDSGTLNEFSYLATDKNASEGFVFGKGGDIIEIKVPVKDAGFVQQSMAGSQGATIQNPVKLVKGSDGIWRAEQWKTKSQLKADWDNVDLTTLPDLSNNKNYEQRSITNESETRGAGQSVSTTGGRNGRDTGGNAGRILQRVKSLLSDGGKLSEDTGRKSKIGESATIIREEINNGVTFDSLDVTPVFKDLLIELGATEDFVNKLESLNKKGGFKSVTLTNNIGGIKIYGAFSIKEDILYLNPEDFKSDIYVSGKILNHEISGHAWFTRLNVQQKIEFVGMMKNNRQVLKKVWEQAGQLYKDYWNDTVDQVYDTTKRVAGNETEQILIDSGFVIDSVQNIDQFLDESFTIQDKIDNLNSILVSKGFNPIKLQDFHTVIVNENVSMIAENALLLKDSDLADQQMSEYINSVNDNSLGFGQMSNDIGLLKRDRNKQLVVAHNISAEKLRKAVQLGGLANPSIAIYNPSKFNFENYGEITLLGSKELPFSDKTKVYAADAYTARFPSIDTSVDFGKLRNYEKENNISFDDLDTSDYFRSAQRSESFITYYLSTKGIQVTSDMDYRQMKDLIKDQDDFNNFIDTVAKDIGIKEQIFLGFTPSGKRKYQDVTLENISKYMNRQKEESFFYGAGTARSKVVDQFKTVKDVIANEYRLVSEQEFEQLRKESEMKFNELVDELSAIHPDNWMDIPTNITSYISGDTSVFKDIYGDVPESFIQKVKDFKQYLKQLPTEYFEAKFNRPVTLNEFSYAVVPENAANETIKSLEDNGLQVVTYKDGDRQNTVYSTANEKNILFKKKEDTQLSSKLIEDLQGRKTAKKAYIEQRIVSSDLNLKQVEKDLARAILEQYEDTVDVDQFSKQMIAELLPLKRKTLERPFYESVTLPTELRGNVANYYENLYELPVELSSSTRDPLHFRDINEKMYGWTRVEDMADGRTRRIIEVQNYITQKAGKENISKELEYFPSLTPEQRLKIEKSGGSIEERNDKTKELQEILRKEKQKITQYGNPESHFRKTREEIKKAAEDGKTKLQFPTGETAMKIEGLGETDVWSSYPRGGNYQIDFAWIQDRGVGTEIYRDGESWVVTEVLGDGKFKAVSKKIYDTHDRKSYSISKDTTGGQETVYLLQQNGKFVQAGIEDVSPENAPDRAYGTFSSEQLAENYLNELTSEENKKNAIDRYAEQFDISGKIDTNNPIYRFYEKDLGRYLKNNYGAKLVTDDQGVTWYEVDVKPEYANQPVMAFKKEDGTNNVSYQKGVETIKKLQQQHGVEFPVRVYKTIYTGEVINGKKIKASGMYFDNTVSLAEKIKQYTAQHEFGHFIFNNLENVPQFSDINRQELYVELRDSIGDKNGSKSLVDLEEHLMKLVEQRAQEIESGTAKPPKTKLQKLVDSIVNFFKDVFSISKSEYRSIEKFLDTMYFGKTTGGVITFQEHGKTSEFMDKRFQEFGEEVEEFSIEDAPSQNMTENEYFDFIGSDQFDENYDYIDEYYNQDGGTNVPVEPTDENIGKVFIEKKDPIMVLADMADQFTGTTQAALEAFRDQLNYSTYELELYEPGGKLIQYFERDGGVDFAQYKRQQANFLTELQPEERQLQNVRKAYEAFKNKEVPKSEKVKFIYNHQIEKAFDSLSEEFQYEIASLLEIYKERVVRNASDLKKDIAFVKQNETKPMSGSQLRKVISNRMADGMKKKYTLTEKKLFTEKIKNLNKGFKTGVKEGKRIATEKIMQTLEDIKREKELKTLRENIIKRSYTKGIIEALRKNVPRTEWATYMNRATNVGISEAKYLNLLQSIYKRGEEYAIEKGDRIDRARMRSNIAYLKKVYDIEPSLILSIKKDLNIRDTYKTGERAGKLKDELKSIKDYSLEELNFFMEELKKRIEFRKQNPKTYLDKITLKTEPNIIQRLLQFADKNIVGTEERQLQNISNALYESVMTVLYQENRNNKMRTSKMSRLFETFGKMTAEDQESLKQFAQSAQEDQMRAILEKYVTSEEVDVMISNSREVLDDIHQQLLDVGVEVPYRKFFFPRKLKPVDSENAAIMIEAFEHKIGKKATDEEKAQIINGLSRGFAGQLPFITLSGKKFEAHRLIETITDDISPFYEDFATSTIDYIYATSALIEQRKFFGKSVIDSLDYQAALEQSIGAKVYALYDQGLIKQKDINEVRKVLMDVFHYKNGEITMAVQKFTSDYIYPIGLGQIASTLRQTKDLSMQILVNDLFAKQFNTLGNIKITTDQVYLDDTFQEIDTGVETGKSKIAKFLEKTMVPFSKADQSFLRVFINGAYRRSIKMAKSGNKEFTQGVIDIFGETDGMNFINELKTKASDDTNIPDQFARWVYSEVARIRPITKLQKARGAIYQPAFYVLKNFMIKQLQFVRRESLDYVYDGYVQKDAKKIAEGVYRLSMVMAVIALLGAGADEIVDWILGKKDNNTFKDAMFGNLLQIVGLNRYTLDMMDQGKPVQVLVGSFAPAAATILSTLVDDSIKDVKNVVDDFENIKDIKLIRKFPGVGDLYYQRFGGGSEYNQKATKGNVKDAATSEYAQNGNSDKFKELTKGMESDARKDIATDAKKQKKIDQIFTDSKEKKYAEELQKGLNKDKVEVFKKIVKKEGVEYAKQFMRKGRSTYISARSGDALHVLISDDLYEEVRKLVK